MLLPNIFFSFVDDFHEKKKKTDFYRFFFQRLRIFFPYSVCSIFISPLSCDLHYYLQGCLFFALIMCAFNPVPAIFHGNIILCISNGSLSLYQDEWISETSHFFKKISDNDIHKKCVHIFWMGRGTR